MDGGGGNSKMLGDIDVISEYMKGETEGSVGENDKELWNGKS